MTQLPLATATFSKGVSAANWQEAVRAAGVDLVHAHAVGPAYVDEMVRQVEESGPYMVIAPGVAVPHGRSGALVRRDGLAIVSLREPVRFGHPYHDPVRLVVALASLTPTTHIRQLSALAVAFDDEAVVRQLTEATDVEAAVAVLAAVADAS